jgi:hypothetical protein
MVNAFFIPTILDCTEINMLSFALSRRHFRRAAPI